MVRATLYMKVKAGREEEFESAWRHVAEQIRHAPGNIRQALMRDPHDPASFVVTSDWESREAFTRFEVSREQDELTAPIRELRDSAQQVVYDLLVHVDAEDAGSARNGGGDR